MKKILTLSLSLLLSAVAFAQGGSSGGNKNDKKHEKLYQVAAAMTKEMCSCFTQYGINQMPPESRKLIEKLVKKNVSSEEEMMKLLSSEEYATLEKAVAGFDKLNDSQLEECMNKITSEEGMSQHMGTLMEVMPEFEGNEDAFKVAFEKETERSMRDNKNCKTFYFFYLIGKKNGKK